MSDDARATKTYHNIWPFVGNRARHGNLTDMPEPRMERALKGIQDILANPTSGLTKEQQLGLEQTSVALTNETSYRTP